MFSFVFAGVSKNPFSESLCEVLLAQKDFAKKLLAKPGLSPQTSLSQYGGFSKLKGPIFMEFLGWRLTPLLSCFVTRLARWCSPSLLAREFLGDVLFSFFQPYFRQL